MNDQLYCPCRFSPRESYLVTCLAGDCAGPTAGLDGSEKQEISYPCRKFHYHSPLTQLVAEKLFILVYICLVSKACHPLNPYLLKIFPYYIYCRLLFMFFETCEIVWVTSYSRNVITSVMKLAPASNCLFTV